MIRMIKEDILHFFLIFYFYYFIFYCTGEGQVYAQIQMFDLFELCNAKEINIKF